MSKICCIGHITKDKIVTPQNTVYMSGGVVFYFAHAINHLPKDVELLVVTKLADADKKAAEEMQKAGINVNVFPSCDTVFFENCYGDNPDERTQQVLAKSDAFAIEELNGISADVYHLGTLLADDFSLDFVKELSKKGKVSVDAQGFLREVRDRQVFAVDWEEKAEYLKYVDIIKVNEKEMEVLTGTADPHEAARQLASYGPSEVLVTLGSQGSLLLVDGEFIDVPPVPAREVVDATGCGDTFMAGYLYQRVQGTDAYHSARFAAAMCTQKLGHNGPFDGSMEELDAMLGITKKG